MKRFQHQPLPAAMVASSAFASVRDPFGSSSGRSQPTGGPKRGPVVAMLAA